MVLARIPAHVTRYRIHDVVLGLKEDAAQAALATKIAQKLGIPSASVSDLRVVKRSLDTRKAPPRYVYTVELSLGKDAARPNALSKLEIVSPAENERWVLRKKWSGPPPVVVGAGPAGLFAALTLAEAGCPPILLERGKSVEPRARDVSQLYARGLLDPESNVCFGEGGAGTFSDGKLYTRVHDGRVAKVLTTFVNLGADPDIRIDHRPHLGTDVLMSLLLALRQRLEGLGTQIHFSSRVDDFVVTEGALRGLQLADGARLDAQQCVLATGHSARTVWQKLEARGLKLEARPFAVGFRVEHSQQQINSLRYGISSEVHDLPAADYRLTYNEPDRGVYSFCMCPGGVVVATPTEAGALCINGMSHASRSGRFANSALVVTVSEKDFVAAGYTGLFSGVDFQSSVERAAYSAGGGRFVAPATRVDDFVAGKVSSSLGATSYRRGLWPSDLNTLYPKAVVEALRRAIRRFDKQMRGFNTHDATLIGVETRTSSPIRVVRGSDLQALGAQGLYPAGEGMGYGGGIVSAAVDGMRAAEALLEKYGAEREVIKDPAFS